MLPLLASLVLLPVEEVLAVTHCPPGDEWVFLLDSCYLLAREKVTWDQAMEACLDKSKESSLLEIQSKEEEELIEQELGKMPKRRGWRKEEWWMGLTDRQVDGEWKWETSGKDVYGGFTNWFQKEPSNNKEDCVRMKMIGKKWFWLDNKCTNKYFYICETGMKSVNGINHASVLSSDKL